MPAIDDLLTEVDHLWGGPTTTKIRLPIIGCSALMLQANYERGTKDGDVLETDHLTPETRDRLLALAGQGSDLHARHRFYVDLVSGGLPFLPRAPVWHDVPDLNARLTHFRIEVLDVIDVVVSKLKRFHVNDQADIDAMVERDLVPHQRLIARFKAAVEAYEMDARIEELPKYIENLHRVERDMLGVSETDIDLPGWA